MQVSNSSSASGPASSFSLAQQAAAVRRRARPMIITAGAILAAALLAATLWPATYRSTGTILIEQQEVPTDVVRAAVTSYADQRVQVISQRVMTSANLLSIADKYKLFPEDRDRETRDVIAERVRKNIKLEMISADVVDPRQGRATKATIAFSVSYESKSPILAARVANELTTLYLSENIETRKQMAAGTAGFLKDEADRLGKRVSELEAQVAKFKTANSERLPEFAQFTVQLIDRSQQELRDLDARMRSLDQQMVFLDSQLAQIDPSGVNYSNGTHILTPRERLKMLRTDYAAGAAAYSAEHPDVKRMKREIELLSAQLGGVDASNDLNRQLIETRSELASAQERYGEDHPDVKRLQRQIVTLETQLEELAATPSPVREEVADNPAFIQIRSQKVAAQNEKASLLVQASQVRQRVLDLERRQSLAPEVEREYSGLMRDLQGEQLKYAEVRQKHLEAQLAENLETERKGERFTLIEPPVVAQIPVSPNRKLIVLLGVVLSGGAAFALMFLLESTDSRIRDRNHVLQLLGVPPLAIVPIIELDEERRGFPHFRRMAGIGATATILALVVMAAAITQPNAPWVVILRLGV